MGAVRRGKEVGKGVKTPIEVNLEFTTGIETSLGTCGKPKDGVTDKWGRPLPKRLGGLLEKSSTIRIEGKRRTWLIQTHL